MKEFVVSGDKFKAVLKMGGVEYKFRSPTKGELKEYSTLVRDAKDDTSKSMEITEDFMSKLGKIPKEELDKIPADDFMALAKHVMTPFGDDEDKKK